MKHVLRRHFFVRDMVEAFEIAVPFVRTEDNAADFLTKPMKNADSFFKWRAIIMNEPARGDSGDRVPRVSDDNTRQRCALSPRRLQSLPLRSNLRRVPAPWFEGGRLRAIAPAHALRAV